MYLSISDMTRKHLLAALVLLLVVADQSWAQPKVFTSDGTEVVLFSDGTWEYIDLPPQRVSVPDGRDAILYGDGTWEYLLEPEMQSTDPVESLQYPLAPQSIVTVFSALWTREQEQKGEFETTTEFRERMNAIRARPIVDSLYESSVFLFEAPNVETQYDADRQEMNFRVGFGDGYRSGFALLSRGNDAKTILVKKIVTRYVSRTHEKNYIIAVADYTNVPGYSRELDLLRDDRQRFGRPDLGRGGYIEISIRMDREVARKLGTSYTIYLNCELKTPLVSEYGSSNLRDRGTWNFYVHVTILDVVLFDKTRGVMVARLRS
jgi:hypothetical protein